MTQPLLGRLNGVVKTSVSPVYGRVAWAVFLTPPRFHLLIYKNGDTIPKFTWLSLLIIGTRIGQNY